MILSYLPAQYAKFITSILGLFILYVSNYGLVWHLTPVVISIGAALGVMGVPNATKE